MGIREWLKKRVIVDDEGGTDVPPGGSLMESLLGREVPPTHALGEYTSGTYPTDVVELLRRRQQVASELIRIDITSPQARQEAIPRIKELLRVYPHALAYELLIQAFLDGRRWDEAKGVAYAARERRLECMRSNLSELRAEVDFLHEWSPEEIDRLREEKEGMA